MNIPNRIENLRNLMTEKNIDVYLVPSDDNHQSEYVGDHFKARAFITGFTGSAGTAFIAKDSAGLFTDGRYFVQAGKQLKGSGVELFKMFEPGVPTLEDHLYNIIPENGVLGFDGRVVSMNLGKRLADNLAKKGATLRTDSDLIDMIWDDRPALSKEPAFFLEEKYSGESTSSKLARVRDVMKEKGADYHVVAALDDINWLTNLRGNDISYFPLILTYAIVSMDEMLLYIDECKLNDSICAELSKAGITLRPYDAIYEDVLTFTPGKKVLIDPDRINYELYSLLSKNMVVIEGENPTVLMKSMKNQTELENFKIAQIKDSVALTRFMKWIKDSFTDSSSYPEVTELSACDKLEEFRKEQKDYIRQSFDPIMAYGENAALPHYAPTKEADAKVVPGSFLLADTGGGYMQGSTDITRTFVVGEVSDIMKKHFTLVMLGNLHLSDVVFYDGMYGFELDLFARQALMKNGLDFNHGTGHGIGYLMSVHEHAASIRFYRKGAEKGTPFHLGMIVSNEPGLYLEGEYGIRLENDIFVKLRQKMPNRDLFEFENMTFVPFDLDAVDPAIMTSVDKDLLNKYHKEVYEKLSPYFTDEENTWLAKYTREI